MNHTSDFEIPSRNEIEKSAPPLEPIPSLEKIKAKSETDVEIKAEVKAEVKVEVGTEETKPEVSPNKIYPYRYNQPTNKPLGELLNPWELATKIHAYYENKSEGIIPEIPLTKFLDLAIHECGISYVEVTDLFGEDLTNLAKIKTFTSQRFEKRVGYFVMPSQGQFHYIKIGELEQLGSNLLKGPIRYFPVLAPGFYVKDKDNIFYVTKQDIQRNVVRLSRQVKFRRYNITYESIIDGSAIVYPERKNPEDQKDPAGRNNSAEGKSASPASSETKEVGSPARISKNNSGILAEISEADELQMANSTLSDQMLALYGIEDSEEGEYEVSDAS